MKFLLTYDVNVGHDEIKDLLIEDGYEDFLKCNDGECYQLPNTTLLVERETIAEVGKDFLAACEIYNRENENEISKSKTRYFITQRGQSTIKGPLVKK